MKGFEKFLPKDKLKQKGKEWSSLIREQEDVEDLYTFYRSDSSPDSFNNVSEIHGVSFIKDVIPGLIAKKKKGEKVRILDIGAGAAFLSDEIRKAFGDTVKVYSTGLSRKVAESYRAKNLGVESRKLHPDDLKWHSVLELSDFEEFDLIIDTFGEFSYDVAGVQKKDKQPESPEKALEYLTAVIKKLKPGGLASIASYYTIKYFKHDGREEIKRLEKEYNVTFTPDTDQLRSVLKIEKSTRSKIL